MRLFQRSAQVVRIAPRSCTTDTLGAAVEGFAGAWITAKANVGFVANALNSAANALNSAMPGMIPAQTLKLRFAGRVEICVGDGVALPGEVVPRWRCVEVDNFPMTTLARLERIVE